MRASFWNFSFWYFHFGNFSSLQSYCGNRKIKYRFFQITRFKERKNMAVELPVITWKKNIYRSKLSVLGLLHLNVCESFLFRQSKKTYTWSV